MSQIKHDKQGFLVGDLVAGQRELLDQQQAGLSIWRGIRTDVRAIARMLGVASRAGGAERSSGKAAEPAGRRSVSVARAGAAGARSDARAAVPRARDAMGRFSATQKAAVVRRAAEEPSAAPPAVALVPMAEATRDVRGRFAAGGPGGKPGGKPGGGEGGEGFGAKLSERLGGLSDAVKGLAASTDQVDPAITAMQEVKGVVEPLGRGFGRLFGRTQEQKKERWYKRILKALTPAKGVETARSAAPGEVRSGSFLGTLAGGLLSKVMPLISGVGPMLLKVLKRVFMPIAALWGSFELGKFIGGKIYERLDESGITTKVFDAFDAISDTISGAWKSTTDTFVKAVEFLASIPKKVEGIFEAIDQGIRKLPVIGDIYAKAADAGKAVVADVKKGYAETRNPVVLDVNGKQVTQDPGASQSLSQSAGRLAGKVAKGAADAKDWALGKTSERFESGGKGAGTISPGKGDAGGASYGTYQLSSKAGTLDKFLQSSGYAEQFKGLKPGSPEFNAQWQKIAREDQTFGGKQHDFIKATHFDPAVSELKKAGIDVSSAGPAVQEALWSTAVQFGAGSDKSTRGAVPMFKSTFAGKDFSSMSDAERVNALQDYKAKNNKSLFAKSSEAVRASTLRRADAERASLLALTGKVPAQSNAVQTTSSVSVPSPVPEKLPPVQAIAMPTPATNDSPKPVRLFVKAPIGQDVGDRNIAHIVSGGISA